MAMLIGSSNQLGMRTRCRCLPTNEPNKNSVTLLQNELFHFLIVLSQQPYPIYETLLTEEQNALKEEIKALLPETEPEA